MLLSRVAYRIYWIGRYVERSENLARLINVYSEFFLDLPRGTGMGWRSVLRINGVDEIYADAGGDSNDTAAIVRFLLTDAQNPGSLLNGLAQARENARTSRDVIPMEAWRVINEMYLSARDNLPQAVHERNRQRGLQDVVRGCQLFSGLVSGTMSRGEATQFARLGCYLERADMATRIIDVAAALLLRRGNELKRFDNTLWMAVLRSMSAYQMYRQNVRRRVNGRDVIWFLVRDLHFPRSMAFSLKSVSSALSQLPRNQALMEKSAATLAKVENVPVAKVDAAELHEFADMLQLEFEQLDMEIFKTWFAPEATA